MVQVGKLNILGNDFSSNWILKGVVAVRDTLLDELGGIDSMFRDNERVSLNNRDILIGEFRSRNTARRADGRLEHPLFYYKKDWYDDWVEGEQEVHDVVHNTNGQILYYTYVWVILHGAIFGHLGECCIGPIAGALRDGAATLHPRTPQFMQFFDVLDGDWADGLYTMSGWTRTY